MVKAFDVQRMIKTPGAVVIPFRAAHLKKMQWSDGAQLTLGAYDDLELRAQAMEQNEMAWTVIYKTDIACCFWLFELWPGVVEASLVPDKGILSSPVTLTRATRRFFASIGPALNLRRLQVTVSAERDEAIRWAEALGFEREGLMRSFGPGGDDQYMYARYY